MRNRISKHQVLAQLEL